MDEWLIEDEYGQVLLHPDAPEDVLESLAGSEWYLVRTSVAERTNDPEVLTTLATDKTASVRQGVAGNPFAPTSALKALSRYKNAGVRQGVARNTSTPADVLSALALDKHVGVRMVLAENPNLPGQAHIAEPQMTPTLSDEVIIRRRPQLPTPTVRGHRIGV